VQVEVDMERFSGHNGSQEVRHHPRGQPRRWRRADGQASGRRGGDPGPQRHRPDSEPQWWAEVYRLAINPGVSASLAGGTAPVSVFGGGQALVGA